MSVVRNNLIEPMSKTANDEKTYEYFYTRLMNCFVINVEIKFSCYWSFMLWAALAYLKRFKFLNL
ncbi:hypothetical protein BpHYR1_018027 [Brachionus plicatilis]|uniref:Uncharacterized protein n=1 Tax=Brachionus plicatilis TaxID=10195 RepID=A0A3M7PLR2_BRAPC|nr:hypothetical protein BpHYR1_018027 [Brachionus plicatilis]